MLGASRMTSSFSLTIRASMRVRPRGADGDGRFFYLTEQRERVVLFGLSRALSIRPRPVGAAARVYPLFPGGGAQSAAVDMSSHHRAPGAVKKHHEM